MYKLHLFWLTQTNIICWLLVWRSSLLMFMLVTGQSEIFQGNIFVSEKCWCTEVAPLTGKCWSKQKFPWEGVLRCTLLSYQSQTLREREKFCHFTLSHPQAEGRRGWSDKSWLFAIPCVCPGLWGHSKAPGQRGSTSSLCLQGPFEGFSPRAEPPPAPSHIDLAGEPSGVNAKMSWMWHKEETHNFSKIFIKQGNRFLFCYDQSLWNRLVVVVHTRQPLPRHSARQ